MDIIKGKLKNGFEFAIPRERFGSYKTLKLLRESKEDASVIVEIVPRLLGDQEEEFLNSIGEDPSFTDVFKAITEIFEVSKQNGGEEEKKSSPLPES